MPTKEEVVRTKNHLEMMKNPDYWPQFILPLTRNEELGILVGDGPTVYLRNMFDSSPLGSSPKKEYKSFEDVVADGWIVD